MKDFRYFVNLTNYIQCNALVGLINLAVLKQSVFDTIDASELEAKFSQSKYMPEKKKKKKTEQKHRFAPGSANGVVDISQSNHYSNICESVGEEDIPRQYLDVENVTSEALKQNDAFSESKHNPKHINAQG